MMKPTEIIGNCHLYLGDCREILPSLPKVDLVLTDPPYGIGADKGKKMASSFNGSKVIESAYTPENDWDDVRPESEIIISVVEKGLSAVVWGGNYFADYLPATGRWLWWDKCQTMPSFGDGELAWTNFKQTTPKKFTYANNKIFADRVERHHPTQKPIQLIEWCIDLAPKNTLTVADPFAGSGTTGVACVRMGKTFYGIEREPKYFDIACKRIEQAYAQARLFA